jgi:integrase
VRFIEADVDIRQITPAQADAYKAHLRSEHRARATVNKWLRYARHYLSVAQRRGLIEHNPFEHISGTVTGDPSKRLFIPAADVARVLDVAPDPQWKLLIALARWGGLRIPSEALALTWGDVDFECRRFRVRSSKTEHHEDGGIRVVPMFPELVEHFQRAFDDAEPGQVHVITRYRDPAANLRTQFVRYIKTAGLKPWPKPWQNLRVSRATELADEYPSHVCAAWLGHTERVADAFYRQVTDEHFARAVAEDASPDHQHAGPQLPGAQNAAQKPHESTRTASKQKSADPTQASPDSKDSGKLPVIAGCFTSGEVGSVGFEPTRGLHPRGF